jgi:glycosyltransferase involved in cell wall biosynthesis
MASGLQGGAAAMEQRLCYLCLEAPREGQASYVHLNEIVAGLRRRGWQVDVLAPKYSDRWARPSAPLRIIEYLRLQWRLTRRLAQFDAIYVRAHPLAFPAAVIAKIFGRPVVHEINGTYGDLYVAYPAARRARRILDALQRWQYRWARGLIAVTPQLRAWSVEESRPGKPAAVVIANGANTDLFNEDAKSALELPKPYVVFFGGLTRWHGVDLMLDALRMPAWPSGVSLVIVGDGPESPLLQEAAQTDSRLVLLGRRPYREIGGIVAGALVGLVPIVDPEGRSSSAGLSPLKLYETLACGVPAVVTDYPGQADIVREAGCGVVVAPDAAALAAAVAGLASDPETARLKGRRGAELVRTAHSWDRRAGETHEFLKSIIATPQP